MSSLLEEQRAALKKQPSLPSPVEPLQEYTQAKAESVKEAKIGCLLLAGGMGSRLGWDGPKGTFPVPSLEQKTLFQLFFEKVKKPLPIAIMTSPQNHAETQKYLQDHQWFGVPEEQVSLFCQGELPYLDEQGNWIFLREKLATGPDGNGYALKELVRSGIAAKWRSQGIQWVNVVLIDNPLSDPFDLLLADFCERKNLDIGIKSILREDPGEQVGVLVCTPEGIRVIEYTELADKTLRFPLANTGMFCFNINFVEKCRDITLPWHVVQKSIPYFSHPVWKFETFLFDIFPYAERIDTLVYPRSEVFAPVKSAAAKPLQLTN